MRDIQNLLRAERLPDAYRETIAKVWTPLARRLLDLPRPALIGLCGPQGSGKSTGARALRMRLEAQGLRVAILSIDDFYLSHAERESLAARVHPLLATRGPPGTHDLALAERVIGALLSGESAALPAFDKSRDDRRPGPEWGLFEGPADLVLFEGWCVGARPEPAAALDTPANTLERERDPRGLWRRYVNESLERYQPLFGRIDFLIQLIPSGSEAVPGWREEQEAKLPKRLMSDAEIAVFVQYYERLTRWMLREMPGRADARVTLGPAREPLALTFG